MAGEQLRLRFQQGEVVVELEGDAPSVRAELDTLLAEGYGRLLDFFGSRAIPTVIDQPNGQPTFAVDRFELPSSTTTYAVDLDGDGVPENRFGGLVEGSGEGGFFDPQPALDEGLTGDAPSMLFRLAMADSDLMADQRVDVSVTSGHPVDGRRSRFEVERPDQTVTLPGMLRAGRFTSQESATGRPVPTMRFPFPVFPAVTFVMTIWAPRISFTLLPDGPYMAAGELNGGVPATFFESLATALAYQLTAELAADPQAPARLFDTGGCTNSDGSSARAGDGVIDVCELNELVPMRSDVYLVDSAGRYQPHRAGVPNAMSFGIGFTGAPVSF